MLIIFDLDDTLIDTSGCITPIKLEDALHQMVAAGLQIEDFASALEQLRRLNNAAESAKSAVAEFLELLEADPKYYDIAIKEIYENITPDLPIFPFDGVLDTLKEIHEFHHLALVTAGKPNEQLWKLKKTGVDTALFSKIAICEDGCKNLHYKQIIEELGFAPSDVLVCGDRVSRDLTPAKDLGLRTIHIRKGRGRNQTGLTSDVDYTIADFNEILDVLTTVGLMNFSTQ